MRKATTLLLSILFTAIAFSQKRSNPKISKNETEISSFILGDEYLAFGGEFVYRVYVIKKLKIGAGVLYGANYVESYEPEFYGYGALFADVTQFVGHREKWSFGGQIGHGIYNPNHGVYTQLRAGPYWSLSCNYRAIVSKRLLFNTSLIIGKRNLHSEYSPHVSANSGFTGLKFGVVF